MDQLAGSVSRMSIAIKLRDTISTGGIVGDIAKDTLENTNLFQKDIAEFTSMNMDDLDDIIEAQAIHIKSKVEPIAAEAQVIEQKMIEGEPAGQILLPHYETPSEQNIAAE